MDAYIEILVARPIKAYDVFFRYELTDNELREIGEFTRQNVLKWMEENENHRGVDWVDKIPVRDFHAVCGDIDIPWQNEASQES